MSINDVGRPEPPVPAVNGLRTEKFLIWFRANLAINQPGRTVARLRGGRFLWWLLIGWLVADPYRELVSDGPLAVVCLAALGAALGLLGSLTALIAIIPMAHAGVPISDQLWWVVPLLIAETVGVVPHSLFRLRTAQLGSLVVLGVPVVAWFTGSRSWLAAVLVLYILVRPYLSGLQWWLIGLTRVNRVQVLWGAVLWILTATLLAMGPPGRWFVGVWPRTPLGWLLGTLCVAVAFATVKFVLLLAVRASLSDIRTLGAWPGLRINRDCFAGVYGGTTALPWFCFLSAGVFHDRWDIQIGCAAGILGQTLLTVVRRADRSAQDTIDRLDAALYVFSAPARRAELTVDWLDDLSRTVRPLSVPHPAGTSDAQRSLRLQGAFALVHVMCDESRKTAFGDVDDTLWLPFRRIGVRPQLLTAALAWVERAIELLDAAEGLGGPPVADAHAAELVRCRQFRSLANFLHGRPEEGILDAAEAARISHEAGAHNTEVIAWNSVASPFFDVPVRHDGGQISRVRSAAGVALASAAGDDRVHPQIRRQIAVAAAFLSKRTSNLPPPDVLLRLASDLPPPKPEEVTMGIERIIVSERGTTVLWGLTGTGPHPLNRFDYTHFLEGTARIEDILEDTPQPYRGRFVRAVLTADVRVPGLRRLQKTMTMDPSAGAVPGDHITIRDSSVVERWIDFTEQRGGWEIATDFREMLGYHLRELDPYRAADHLVRALQYRQHVQFGILDEDLRMAVRGAAEVLGEIVIDHVAGLALHPVADPGPPLGASTLQLVMSVKSRSFLELMGDRVPPLPDGPLAEAERQAQQRYDEARAATDHARLREAREDLELCWSRLDEAGGHEAEYAALRAGLPISHAELGALLTDLAT